VMSALLSFGGNHVNLTLKRSTTFFCTIVWSTGSGTSIRTQIFKYFICIE